ncbi:ISAs1 family transposase [Microcoleus sp. herbarium19]|uniref:ISAs1 family transposase n=1 Tax=unclassified Microcoleus TaxID=2642155 RepID=UPI002FD1133F
MDFEIIAVLFNRWTPENLSLAGGELMAIDGKNIKSTLVGGNSSYQNFVSMVSVYSHKHGWVVRHKVMENQHWSEIEVVEELVKELSGCQSVITADVLPLKKTLPLIIEGGNDYIITIKKNQPSLYKAAE